jgi:predicted O-linked N-acetylglucosamine transferase (SPINDLY family)
LDAIRGTLRARFAASTLVDSARHVRELEAVYRDLWRAYCVNPAGADR